MTDANLESFYEVLAIAIDDVEEEKTSIFLAKLCLALAKHIDDQNVTIEMVKSCQMNLD